MLRSDEHHATNPQTDQKQMPSLWGHEKVTHHFNIILSDMTKKMRHLEAILEILAMLAIGNANKDTKYFYTENQPNS